mmetsp:Transcript_22326/g.66172  ORF Transcript_22326/g.66172 Transcript_22326/m.66172 type:complete len:307 (-) Transcript_22326:143-1063(-)
MSFCTILGGYKFNNPYLFFKAPSWRIIESNDSSIIMESEEILDPSERKAQSKKTYGYRLRKSISISDGLKADATSLIVETTLTNLGSESFSTPWYSHHFFTCDGYPVGADEKGYAVDFDINPSPEGQPLYSDLNWATPLGQYADVTGDSAKKSVRVALNREVEEGIRMKIELPDDGETEGAFVLHGCGASVSASVPSTSIKGQIEMYAFNLYAERGTLSPEALFLISAKPGESVQWAQHITFAEDSGNFERRTRFKSTQKGFFSHSPSSGLMLGMGVLGGVLLSMKVLNNFLPSGFRQNDGYSQIE